MEIIEVKAPKEFDDVYNIYSSLQKEQGLPLEKYAGKSANGGVTQF